MQFIQTDNIGYAMADALALEISDNRGELWEMFADNPNDSAELLDEISFDDCALAEFGL